MIKNSGEAVDKPFYWLIALKLEFPKIPLVSKKQFFFQRFAVAKLPILPVINVDALHQLQIHVGL